MNNDRNEKFYNILLPLWLIIFLPSYLWLILIPLNYIIDRVVLKWSLGDMPEKGLFCRKHTWKICIAGFLSDFAGALILFGLSMFIAESEWAETIGQAIMFDPFSNLWGMLIVILAIAVSAVCIFFLDKWILRKAGLEPEQVKRSAIRLALITAPYLFLFPSKFLYDGGAMSLF